MGPNVLVLLLQVSGTLPSFPAPSTTNWNQMERFNTTTIARAEMETIATQIRKRTALGSKLPPATKYIIRPGVGQMSPC